MDQGRYKRICEERSGRLEAQYNEFKPYLVDAPAAFVKAKAEVFQVDAQTFDSLLPLIICGLKRPIVLHPRKTVDLGIVEIGQHTRYVNPRSLDHVKELGGVPNGAFEQQRKQGSPCECNGRWKLSTDDLRELSTDKRVDFEQMGGSQRAALHRAAAALLYGYAAPDLVAKSPYDRVADYLLERFREIPTFVGNELIVCPGESVRFDGYAAVYFNNVIVVGSGQIHLGHRTKLHAYQIRHV